MHSSNLFGSFGNMRQVPLTQMEHTVIHHETIHHNNDLSPIYIRTSVHFKDDAIHLE